VSNKPNFIVRFIRHAFGVNEVLRELQSIDSRLKRIEGCVSKSKWDGRDMIVTGQHNDR
jgi:hypothetical protein